MFLKINKRKNHKNLEKIQKMSDQYSRLKDTLITEIKKYSTVFQVGDPGLLGGNWASIIIQINPAKYLTLASKDLAIAIVFLTVNGNKTYQSLDFSPGGPNSQPGRIVSLVDFPGNISVNLTANDKNEYIIKKIATVKRYIDYLMSIITKTPEVFK